jgi:GGDEF domain-containing protein
MPMRSSNRIHLYLYVAGALLLLAAFAYQALHLRPADIISLALLEALYGGGIATFVSTDYKRQMLRRLDRVRRQLEQRFARPESATTSFTAEYFMQRLQQECDRSRRYKLSLTLVALRFHPRGGAAASEELHASIAADVFSHVALAMRAEDVLGRLNALDYCMYLPHTGREGAAIVTERLLSALETYLPTIGLGIYGEDGATAQELLTAALRAGESKVPREEINLAWNAEEAA